MPNVLLPIRAGTLATDCYPATPQELLVLFSDNQEAVLEAGMAFYNFGNTKPAAEFEGYPWLNSNDMQWYKFDGNWIRPHLLAPGSIERRFVIGDSGTINTLIANYDGGDTSAPSDRSGPMWEIDPAFNGRIPIGSGAIPGRTLAPTSLSVEDTLGAGEHLQSGQEVGPHTHPGGVGTMSFGVSSGQKGSDSGNAFDYQDPPPTEENEYTTTQVPIDIMPLVICVAVLMRSSRLYYIVP